MATMSPRTATSRSVPLPDAPVAWPSDPDRPGIPDDFEGSDRWRRADSRGVHRPPHALANLLHLPHLPGRTVHRQCDASCDESARDPCHVRPKPGFARGLLHVGLLARGTWHLCSVTRAQRGFRAGDLPTLAYPVR